MVGSTRLRIRSLFNVVLHDQDFCAADSTLDQEIKERLTGFFANPCSGTVHCM